MGEQMYFEKTWEEFLEKHSFKDKERLYTNGANLIPAFRVEQMVEHYFTNNKEISKISVGVNVAGLEELDKVIEKLEKINEELGKIENKVDINKLFGKPPIDALVGGYENRKRQGGE